MPSRRINIAITLLLPVAWVALRIAFGLTGWIMIFYLMVVMLPTFLLHGILTSIFRWETSDKAARMGTWLYGVAISCYLLSALAFNDGGDTSDSFTSSPINDLTGHGDAIGMWLGVTWVVCGIFAGAIVLIAKPDRLKKNRTRR